ncbi:two-component system, NtrC family, C4-dicarboxylate transport sensor histidine kinase DctB [Formivibrio citricus]|uniref:C4-dicarboxylate transport sensor protein DctB n=1 Tax=Formivibrio citricus TaxID=83765 RepID=A0A1I5BGK0_9NEIS|nr:ATP-binding protein [Formivibrio citricus]SFN73689.1 two-component system, NtrC family, C4-dicarboxylate transport sensor histidine kinase DctB [Formivibrio citricus]
MSYYAPRKIMLLGKIVLLACLALSVGYLAYRASEAREFTVLRTTSQHRLEVYAASLEREIEKYTYFPATLGLERDVIQLLSDKPAQHLPQQVSLHLEKLNSRAGTLSIYILNRHGKVVASSNWQQKDSFIGEDLAYRPYYRDAMDSGSGRFFGIGTTIGEPGYYLSSALAGPGGIIGVAVVKVGLEQLEKSWSGVEAPVLLEDENGIVILSSVQDWKFSAMRALDEATRREFDQTFKYNRRALLPFPGKDTRKLDNDTRIVSIPRPPNTAPQPVPETGMFMAQSQTLPGSSWRLSVFSPTAQVEQIARTQGALAAMGTVLLLICLLMANERRRRIRDRLAAREALQKAHDELERKVAERTAELSEANIRLQQEVEERTRAEQTLREAQDGLVQAGKLAIIGQLSTSIAHEINQPLAVLSVLSRNALRLQQRGEYAEVESNLERMGKMVDQMGQITGHLKTFARKSPESPSAVSLQKAIDNTLFLVEQRLKRKRVSVDLHFPEADLLVWCDPVRLEQVLLNLVSNALDAMESTGNPRLEIEASKQADRVRVHLRDHGPGLSEQAQQHLFEPFFTTKAPGVGLGLGLVISAGIVRDFGGSLAGENAPDDGAIFTLEIPASNGESHD